MSNETLPAPVAAPGGLARFTGGKTVRGMEDLRPSDIGARAPQLQIIHKVQTAEEIEGGYRPGYYRINKAIFPSVDIVFLRVHAIRVLAEKSGEQSKNICASEDGRHPHEDVPAPKARECDSCPYSQWDEDPVTKKRKKPPCDFGLAFIGLVLGHDGQRLPDPMPVWFLTKGTATQAGQGFCQDVRATPDIEGLAQVLVRLTTKQNNSKAGGVTWYTPIFTGSRLSLDAAQPYLEMQDYVANARYRMAIHSSDEAGADPAKGGVPGGPEVVKPGDLADLDIPF